jgi:RHS repeat-associated protein
MMEEMVSGTDHLLRHAVRDEGSWDTHVSCRRRSRYHPRCRRLSRDVVHRYYDPASGQLVTVDPLVELTADPYGYAGEDPADESDPSGLCGWNPLCYIGSAYHKVQNFGYEHASAICQRIDPFDLCGQLAPSHGFGTLAGATGGDWYTPNHQWLKQRACDPHEFKQNELESNKDLSNWDIERNKKNGDLRLVPRDGGPPVETPFRIPRDGDLQINPNWSFGGGGGGGDPGDGDPGFEG